MKQLFRSFLTAGIDPDARLPEYVLVSDTCAALTIALIVAFMSEQMRLAEKHLEDEHRKSEGLLLNILPKPIAERLKNEPQTIADGFPHVTVLFSDIVGFTPMSEQLAPEQLVEVLNKLFTGFDRIAAKHGLEKIKTIGDAYMVASGVPVPTVRHAHDVAEMAMRGLPCSPGRAARLAERSQTATSSGTGRARRVSRKARSHDRG